MDLSVKRSGLERCELVFEYSMPVEASADAVVPDSMPDVERILYADGTALIRGKDLGEGRVSVNAVVAAAVLYVPEGGQGARSLEASVPVNLEVDAPAVTEESLAVVKLHVLSVEARLHNPRKLLIRAVVNVDIACFDRGRLEISTGLEGGDAESVETLYASAAVCPVVCVKEKTFVVSDEFRLQPGLLPMGSVLWHSAEVLNGSVRNVGSKVIFNGTVKLGVLYEAAAGGELCQADFETEFSQMLDTEAELTSPDCGIYTMLTAEYLEPVTLTGGEKGISAEFHLVSQCICSDSSRVQYLADCYSNSCELVPIAESTEVCGSIRRSVVRASAGETLNASPMPVNIVRVFCRAGAAECENGALRCPVNVTVLYTASDGCAYTLSRRLSCEAPAELAEGESAAAVSAVCVECPATIVQGGLDLRAVADFELLCTSTVSLEQIVGLECSETEESEERPSVIVIRAAEGDTLWALGKRCHSTSALILALNGLDEGEKLAGKVLLIPNERK